nr:MAG TPA: tail tape measure protein [Caudoviricetes sp.]
MNTNQGALYFGAGIDMNEWRRNITEMRQDILGLTQQTQRETQQMDSAFKNLSIGIGAYFSVQALQGFTQQLIGVRGEFQKTEIAFGTMLKSEEKAQALMGEMVDLAAKTPFGLTDVTDGAKRLLAFQVPAEQVVDTLRRMGDVAAGLGVPMGQLIHVYGQVKAQGKLMTNDLYQFMNAGIPMTAELAKVMGVAENEVKDLISAGKVGFPEVQSVINNLTNEGGLFFNLMEQQSASLSGQIANLEDAIEQMYNKIGEKTEGFLSSGIQGITFLVENYEKVGVVLAGLVGTYGAYRAAVITQVAVMKIANIQGVYDVATRHLQIGATIKQIALQSQLNAVMMANPYALAIAGVVGLIAVLYSLDTALESGAEKLQKINKETDDYKNEAQNLIGTIKSETATIYEKQEAYKKLLEIAPETFKNMSQEQIMAMNLTEVHKKLNEELEKNQGKKIEATLEDMKKEMDSLLKLKDLNVDDADGRISGRIEELRKGIADIERAEKSRAEAIMSQNAPLEEQLNYWKDEEKKINDVIEKIKKTHPELDTAKAKAGEIPAQFAKMQTAIDGLDFAGLISRLKYVQNQAGSVKNALQIGEDGSHKKADKYLNKNEVEAEIKRLQEEKAELTEIAQIKEKNKEIDKYRLLAKKWDDNPLQSSKPKKQSGGRSKADAPLAGSLGALESELSKINERLNNKTLISDAKTRATLLAKREALEKRIAEVKKLYIKKSFDEEIAELERQWKVRYQIEAKYGKETAKNQFSDLKGKSYFDEIKSRFDALDKKQLSGVKLSDDEINQWQKLKEILDSLTGEKDPFTNWKESLDEQLSSMSTFSEKIGKIKEEIENLTPEQRSQGYEAELRNRLDEQEKAYKEAYNQFLEEHQTYKEKELAIVKKYADLMTKAQTEAEQKRVEDAKNRELGSLSMDMFMSGDEWKIAFGELEYFSQDTLKRILAHFRKFKEENKENLSPDDLDRLKDGIARLETATTRNPFKALINSLKEYKSALADQKKAKEEFDKALNSGNIDAIIKKQKELTEAERRTAEERKKLANVLNQTQSAFNEAIQGINDMADAFGGMSDAARDAMEDITNIANSGIDLAKNIVSGNVVGAVASGIKMIGSIFKALSGDKKKERAIQREQRALNRLKTAYEELSHAANKAFNARQYSDQTNLIKNLEQQSVSLNNMIRAEASKKKTDWGKISDWQGQISAINRTISDLKEGVIKDVLQTDLAGAASKVGDALVDAFSRGENAAQSLEKVANDMVKNLVKNQLNLMLQKRMQGTLQSLFKATGLNEDGTGVFKGLSKEDIARFKSEVKSAGAGMQSFLEGYKEIFEGVDSNDDSLKGAIKGMSEETASVLAGQFNAIRINTGEILKNQKQNLEAMKNSVDSLVKIEQNTFNLFQMRKDLSELNNKVKGDGSLRASGI